VAFAGSAILNAARNELEQNIDTLALTASNALVEPLRELYIGPGKILKIQQTLLQISTTHPELHYTIYSAEGIPLIDSKNPTGDNYQSEIPVEIRQALQSQNGRGSDSRIDLQGENTIYVARRIEIEGDVYGVIRVGAPLQPARAAARPLLLIMAMVAAVVTLTVTIFAWMLARNLTRPIQHLTVAATQLAQGDLDTRVNPVGPRELRRLADAFNNMAVRLQGYVDELRAFAANASHELRTPLTIVKLRTEALRSGALTDPPVAERFLEEIEGEVDRLARMVTDLLDLSRMEAGLADKRRTQLNLASIVDDVYETFQIRAERAEVKIKVIKDSELPTIMGNEDQIHRVLYNLLDNALRYTPKDGNIEISLDKIQDGSAIRLAVKDSGPGIAPEHLQRIFERFYRAEATRPRYAADKASSGTGLGLAIAKSIVEFHGGKIGVSSQLGEGSIFYADLPVSE